MKYFHRPKPFVAFVVASAFAVLCGLGVWQLQRLQWKTALIDRLTINLAAAPIPLPARSEPVDEFIHVDAKGSYTGQEFFMGGKYHGRDLGYHVYAPLKLLDGRTVLVNRGWIPTADRADPNALAARTAHLAKPVDVDAVVRLPKLKRWFMPANNADKNLWFTLDLPAMSGLLGTALEPYYLEQLGETDALERETGVTPRHIHPTVLPNGKPQIPNDHLQYAVTWFGIALVLLAMFVAGHWRKPDARG